MILTVIRPAYFPTISVFAKALVADVIVWADSFQYEKHGNMNRTLIKTVDGARWLTVPVLSKGLGFRSISAVQIDNSRSWQKGHLRTLELNYQMAPYFYQYWDELEDLFSQQYESLSELDLRSTIFVFRALGMKKSIIKSSELPQVKDRSERVIAWMKECQCQDYLFAQQEMSLINTTRIEKVGFKTTVLRLAPVTYHQQFRDFLHQLSILDLLFNEGEQSFSIAKNGILAFAAGV